MSIFHSARLSKKQLWLCTWVALGTLLVAGVLPLAVLRWEFGSIASYYARMYGHMYCYNLFVLWILSGMNCVASCVLWREDVKYKWAITLSLIFGFIFASVAIPDQLSDKHAAPFEAKPMAMTAEGRMQTDIATWPLSRTFPEDTEWKKLINDASSAEKEQSTKEHALEDGSKKVNSNEQAIRYAKDMKLLLNNRSNWSISRWLFALVAFPIPVVTMCLLLGNILAYLMLAFTKKLGENLLVGVFASFAALFMAMIWQGLRIGFVALKSEIFSTSFHPATEWVVLAVFVFSFICLVIIVVLQEGHHIVKATMSIVGGCGLLTLLLLLASKTFPRPAIGDIEYTAYLIVTILLIFIISVIAILYPASHDHTEPVTDTNTPTTSDGTST